MSHEHTEFVLACRHVASRDRPILLVWRHTDGRFGLECGYEDHDGGKDYVNLCKNCVLEDLPEMNFMEQLEPGQDARRSNVENLEWEVENYSDGEDET